MVGALQHWVGTHYTLLATIIFWTPDINIVILFLFLFLVDKPVRMMLEKLNYHKQEGKFVS